MIYEMSGRTLMVQFKCGRCGKTQLEEASLQGRLDGGNILNYTPPAGWLNSGMHHPLFCPKCAEEFRNFLANKGEVK